jgi:hypothetical protein
LARSLGHLLSWLMPGEMRVLPQPDRAKVFGYGGPGCERQLRSQPSQAGSGAERETTGVADVAQYRDAAEDGTWEAVGPRRVGYGHPISEFEGT